MPVLWRVVKVCHPSKKAFHAFGSYNQNSRKKGLKYEIISCCCSNKLRGCQSNVTTGEITKPSSEEECTLALAKFNILLKHVRGINNLQKWI